MALSWNEVKERAAKFSKEWENDFNEDAEAKSFMDDFFNVFGVPRRRVASFEINVKKEGGKQGFIDLLWKGNLLIEFKSKGKDLDKAHTQAKGYFPGLKDNELPRYILVSDFERFRLYDLEEDSIEEFKLKDLVKNVQHFGFILGYQKKIYKEQDPANIKAAELMGKLHDRLKEIGYEGHALEVYLVRLLFCLFAEDTTIFNKQQFQDYIEQRTHEDGSDLAPKLQELFQVLNTSERDRFKNIDQQLNEFPYVNGKLFEEILPNASFDLKMRQSLLDCCYLDWSKISPAIFGSMFQSVMNPKERRNLGAHYTSEKNILKLIKPLFLDELWAELESIPKTNKRKLSEFHDKLSTLKFLDPACGCGNFLIITYRELRLLELAVLRSIYKSGEVILSLEDLILLNVDQFYGIEYEEFPARIAEVAMWLIDHQMNMQISNEFGQYYTRLPLKKSAKIVHGDALVTDWEDVIAKRELSFIIGNPPFIGSKIMTQFQRDQIVKQFDNADGCGVLDYVTGWYIKAAKYIQNTKIKVAFVSTNSIVQGEQTSILWGQMLNKYNIKIHFAHRTFKWSNEARGNAAVYCVIVGFASFDTDNKIIYEYQDIKGDAQEIKAKNINPYLVDSRNILIVKRRKNICGLSEMSYGSMANDGGFLILNDDEKILMIQTEPLAAKYLKAFCGSYEFINNVKRWCIWLKDVPPEKYSKLKPVLSRLEEVKNYRLKSTRLATRKLADYPSLFGEIRQPLTDFLIVPGVSSENRKYIPIGYLDKNVIASDLVRTIPDASLYIFGVLTSIMHMVWVRHVCGRLKSDFRYSGSLVYNNYPWPENPSDKQIKTIEKAAQKVLDVRSEFPKSSLADLYDPITMPPALVKAHNELDKVVDLAYRAQVFTSDAKRMEFLFELYEKYTVDLFSEKTTRTSKKK